MIDLLNKLVILIIIFFILRMNKELEAFDLFVDDIISSEQNLLKGELDYLIMQYIFDSLELDNFNDNDNSSSSGDYAYSYLVA